MKKHKHSGENGSVVHSDGLSAGEKNIALVCDWLTGVGGVEKVIYYYV